MRLKRIAASVRIVFAIWPLCLGFPLCLAVPLPADPPAPPASAPPDNPALPAPADPAAPTELKARPVDPHQIALSWTAGTAPVDGFKIQRSTDGTSYTDVATVKGNRTFDTLADLKPGTTYFFRVRAFGTRGDSAGTDPVAVATYGQGIGLTGTYFHRSADGQRIRPMFTRIDPYISFDWNDGLQGDTSVPEHNFLIVWTGQIQALYSETYTFYTVSDDGARLWVDGKQLVNNWTEHAPTEDKGTIDLKAGRKYDIRLGYYENNSGSASIQLLWSSPSQPKGFVLPGQLYPKTAAELAARKSRPAPAGRRPRPGARHKKRHA